MKSTVENVGPTRVKLSVQLSFDEMKPSFDAVYKKLGQQIRIPGFRPGKAPARIIDQRVGRAAILEEVINEALPKAYSEAVQEAGIAVIGQPDIEVTNVEDNDFVSFEAQVDVRPEITLPDLDSIEVTVDGVEASEAEVDEQLEALRGRFASLKSVERALETGDSVTLDVKATVDGDEVEGSSASNLSYEVGAADLIDGLDDAIAGKSAGESATFATTLQQGEHAGREADISVTINSVKERQLPAVDDDFAQMASEFDTVDELKDDLRERLARAKRLNQGAQARDRVLEHLIDVVDFPLPEGIVKAEMARAEHDVIHQLNHDEALFERFLEAQGKTRESFTAELQDSAEKSIKVQLLLDEVATAREVSVGDAELTEYLIRQAARYNMPPSEFANKVVEAGNLPALIGDVRRNKALAVVLESASILDPAGNKIDLASLREGMAAADEADFDDYDEFDDHGHDHGDDHDHDHDH